MALSKVILVAALGVSEAAKAAWDGQHGTDPEPTVPSYDNSFNKYPHEKTFGNLKDVANDEKPTVEDHFSKLFPHKNQDFADDFVSDDDSDNGEWAIAHNYDETRMAYGEDLAVKEAMDKKAEKAKEEVDDFKPVVLEEKKRVGKVEKQLAKIEKAKDKAADKAAKIFDKKNYEAEVAEAKDEMEEDKALLRGTEKQQKLDKKEVEKQQEAVKKAEDAVDADLKKKLKEAAEKVEDAEESEKESKEAAVKLQGQLKDAKKHANDMVKTLAEEEAKFKEAEETLRQFRNGEHPSQSLMQEETETETAVPQKSSWWPF